MMLCPAMVLGIILLSQLMAGPVRALACHANGAVICTAAAHASQHAIRVWAAPDGFSWRAYAPNFEELHENITYNEREDEFDNTVDSKAPSQPQAELEALLGAHGCNLDDVLRVEATVFDAASGEYGAHGKVARMLKGRHDAPPAGGRDPLRDVTFGRPEGEAFDPSRNLFWRATGGRSASRFFPFA